jgi:ParB-like chromosome segregation protein Spo0J
VNNNKVKVEVLELDINELTLSQKNPRTISKKDFAILKRSIKEFPSMLEVREVVVDENNRVLGGHQRIKALQAQGKTKVKVKKVSGWTEEQKDEFMIKDNIANGEWDNDKLANEWDKDKLESWGLPLKIASAGDYKELLDVSIPYYTPAENAPAIEDLADTTDTDALAEEIANAKIPERLKKVMLMRAAFFTDFDFQKIADYYAHADEKTQELMKRLGLVIVIPKEAYEMGMCDFRESFDDEE